MTSTETAATAAALKADRNAGLRERDSVLMLACHCRNCQRSSGGPSSSFAIVPTEAFKLLQSSLHFYASPSGMKEGERES